MSKRFTLSNGCFFSEGKAISNDDVLELINKADDSNRFKDGDFCRVFRIPDFGQVLLKSGVNDEDLPYLGVEFKSGGVVVGIKLSKDDDSDESFESIETALKDADFETVAALCAQCAAIYLGDTDDE